MEAGSRQTIFNVVADVPGNLMFSRPAQPHCSTADMGPHRALESMLFHQHEDQASQCRADTEG
jgi:hypothetical protein